MPIKVDEKTKVFVDNEIKSINANKDKITEEKRYIRAEMLKLFKIDCLARTDIEKERLRFLLLYCSVLTEQYKLLFERSTDLFELIDEIKL